MARFKAHIEKGPVPAAPESELHRRRVLIVEPDTLTRWSLETYLLRWCAVECVEQPDAAARRLRLRTVDVLILSDALPAADVENLEAIAENATPPILTIRMGTESDHQHISHTHARYLEKPFDLALLRPMIGVAAQ